MLSQNLNSKYFYLILLISTIPISYIAGNLILNLNTLLVILFALYLFKLDIFKTRLTSTDFLIIIFFLYLSLNGLFNNFFNFNFSNAPEENIILIKSLSYLRFLILYYVIKYLVIKNIINFKIIFISFGILSFLVSVDLIIQKIFGQDIFGFRGTSRRLSGPFGDEYIAGSFIQRFFIFLPFSILLFLKPKKNFFTEVIFIITLLICFLGTLFSGNRIPMMLFLMILVMIFIYEKTLRRSLIVLCIIFISSALPYSILYNKNIEGHYKGFITKSHQIIDYVILKIKNKEVTALQNSHIKEIESGVLTWKKNKYFGGGIKSFYYHCSSIKKSAMDQYGGTNCNMHPHNYYLQIAAELGLIGLLIISVVFFSILVSVIKLIHFKNDLFNQKKILIPLFIIFFVEILPFKTTGGFFTTTNSTFLFIIIGIIVGLKNQESKNLNV